MSGVTTHVLDLAAGRPAAGVRVLLQRLDGAEWTRLGRAVTGDDGRAEGLGGDAAPAAGIHRLVFTTGEYFEARGTASFFPEVVIMFSITDPAEHHHVPLLLSPFGYSTYRGS